MWRCPTCKSFDYLDVDMNVWGRLEQDEDDPDDFQTDTDLAENNDHEWDGSHPMICFNPECADNGKGGKTASDFKYEKPTPCACCEEPLVSGDGDNWGDICPGCADKVSAYMDAKHVDEEDATEFIRDNPTWDPSDEDEDEDED